MIYHKIKIHGTPKVVSLTRTKAIRCHCLECQGNSSDEVKECTVTDCPLHEYRLGHVPEELKGKERYTRSKAIRLKCKDCAENNPAIRDCGCLTCPTWHYRGSGHVPDPTQQKELKVAYNKKKNQMNRQMPEAARQKLEAFREARRKAKA